MSAFQDDFTHPYGAAYFISVQPDFQERISEVATLIARSHPEPEREAFISQFAEAAAAAAPAPAGAEEDEAMEDGNKEVETEETRAAKQQVVKRVLEAAKGLTLQGHDKEFEGFSNLILALIQSTFGSDNQDFSSLVLALVDALSLSGDRIALPTLAARYSAIATIFNSLPLPQSPTVSPASTLRLAVLIKLVNYAASNDDFTVVAPALGKLESWLVQWGFGLGTQGEEEGNAAVEIIVNALLEKAQAENARTVLLAHLAATSAVAGQSATPSASAGKLASTLIAVSLAQPAVYDFAALAKLPAVAAPSVPALGKLLAIFQTGDLAAFEAFAGSESAVLEAHKLDRDALSHKLRLLALAELCSTRVGESVSYDEVAQALKLTAVSDDGEEVETWVIDAIRAKLISGRLSQPQLQFHVTKATPRTFTQANWSQLQGRLEGWRAQIDAITDSVAKGLQIDGPSAHDLARREEPAQQEVSA